MFHKAKCFNHQLVQFKIKSTLVNRDAYYILIYVYIENKVIIQA